MKMNKKDLFALMGKLDDHYIAASAYIAEGGEDMAYERPARRRAAAFFQSGWFVAILCAVVSLGVVGAMVWAGRQEPAVVPPAGTEEDSFMTEGETSPEIDLELPENIKIETEDETTDEGGHRQKVTVRTPTCTGTFCDVIFYVIPHPEYEYHHVCNPWGCPACDKEKNEEGEQGNQTSESVTNDDFDIHIHVDWVCSSDKCRTQIGWYYTISELQMQNEQHYIPIDEEKYFNRSFGSIQEAIDFACGMITEPVHTQYVEYDFVNATCLENGHNKKTVCHACDKVFMDLGRHLATGHELVNDRCSVCGIVAGEGLLFVPYGNGTCYIAGFAEDASDRTQAVIPLYAPNGDRVVTIAEGAFAGCEDLICVQIPPTIRRIEANAFTDCPNLSVLYSNVSRGNWMIDVVKIDGWCDESLKLNFGDHWAYWTPDGKTHDYVAP